MKLVLVAALFRREQADSASPLARQGGPVSFVQLSEAEVQAAQARSSAAPVLAQVAGAPEQAYATDCDCAAHAAGGCSPSKVHLQQDRASSIGLSLVDASRIFESQGLPKFAEVKQQAFYCLDDRVEPAGLATPGGDLGEFVLALQTYQDLTAERQVTQHMVDVWLQKYVKSFPAGSRQLVHCTDDKALRHLQDQLQDETLDLHAPPAHSQPALLEALGEVPNLGDAHFRLMLKEPENYHVDPALVQMSIRSFYTLLWDAENPLHDRVKLLELTGAERPAAFLEVMALPGCMEAGMAPLLAARGKASFLISSMDAVHLRRAELADFFALRLGSALPTKVDRSVLLSRLDRHGLQALELTGSRVAKDLPFYSLHFT